MEAGVLGIAHGVRWVKASASLAHGVTARDACIYDTTWCFESVSETAREKSCLNLKNWKPTETDRARSHCK